MKKLNKRGFTLVELLAVIAILAILMLLVMPNVLGMFTRGREDAFVTEAQSLWKAAEQKYVTDSIGGTTPGPYCKNSGITTGCTEISGISTSFKYYIDFDTTTGTIKTFNLMDNNFNIVNANNIDFKNSKDADGNALVKSNGSNKVLKCTSSNGTVTCAVSAS